MGAVKNAIVYITDDNPRFISFTKNAVKYAKKFLRDCHVVVLTTKKGLRIDGADKCWWIGKYLDEFTKMAQVTRFPRIIFTKYLIPVLPELRRYDKIVCYDPDTMITSSKIMDVFNIDLGKNYYGLCPDSPSDPEYSLNRLRKYGVKELINDEYFCVGMIAYNIELIRSNENDYADNIANLVSFAERNNTEYPEQDPINCLMSVTKIPIEYDKFVGLNSSPVDWKKFRCVHFCGMRKKKMLDAVCKNKGYVL